jgi:TRAP-type C4-dicarboxylate transport system permease small subunit
VSSMKTRSAPVFAVPLWLVENFERLLVCCFLSLFSVVLILQVFMRFVLRDPLSWPEEFSRYLLIWTAFIGSSLAVKEARFINIDILPLMATGVVRKALHLVMHLGFLVFCGLAIYFSYDFILRIASSGQVSPAMGIPMWIVYMAAPVGLGLAALRTLQAIFLGGPSVEHHYEDKS